MAIGKCGKNRKKKQLFARACNEFATHKCRTEWFSTHIAKMPEAAAESDFLF